MDIGIVYIGLAQALFSIVLISIKKPYRIADVILCLSLLVFAVLFCLDIFQFHSLLPAQRSPISLSLNMLFAPLFYLYSKYITKDYKNFERQDFLHFLPSLIIIAIFTFLKLLPSNSSVSFYRLFDNYRIITIFFGVVFQVLLIYYTILAIRIVIEFKKKVKNFYSFKSYKNSLNWLLFMISLFVTTFFLIIFASVLFETEKVGTKAYTYRHIVEIFFVYILSIWGFNQNQLNVAFDVQDSSKEIMEDKDAATVKYQKSGLKNANVQGYLDKLIKYMEESKAWQDPELSITKLASQISLPKHQLSELLNEHLGKSFYVFVNQYRIEHAKKLLADDVSGNWSILAVAYDCGFNSKTAFNVFFKKYTQQTPSEFKQTLSATQNSQPTE